jgi:hypothetical protein
MKIFLICLMLTIFPPAVYAKTETIYASFKYTMGDNDTKNDAKRIAFMEAKRLLVEKAGVIVESETTVVDGKLSHDEIKTYTAAILKIEVAKEDFQITGETQAVTMTVKSEIDPDEVRRTLNKISEDKSLQKKIKEQQQNLIELEMRIQSLQSELAKADNEKALQLRKERSIVFQQMSKLEKIKFNIEKTTKTAMDVIERGMTKSEVKSVAGSPRTIDLYQTG